MLNSSNVDKSLDKSATWPLLRQSSTVHGGTTADAHKSHKIGRLR